MKYKEIKPTLEIKLDKISSNYNLLHERVGSDVVCSIAVKADAYGLGAVKVVPRLYKQGCREFYVAYADEAFAIEKVLPADATIFVLHGVYGSGGDEFIDKGFIPVLNSIDDIEYWSEKAKIHGKKLPVSIHIDTGMNRLGLSINDFSDIKESLSSFDVKYVMSHLACSEDISHPKNVEQLEKFRYAIDALGVKAPISFANSGGVFLGKDYHFNQVRPGAAIYGINPIEGKTNPMESVVSLKIPILQLRDVKKGETVGYGAKYLVESTTKLATISVGYADGFLRYLLDRGNLYFKGQKCPIVGRVSMDTIVVDVGHLDALEPKVGDMVEVLGNNQTVDDLGKKSGTIGYEILTSLGNRYKRIYSG